MRRLAAIAGPGAAAHVISGRGIMGGLEIVDLLERSSSAARSDPPETPDHQEPE